MLAEVDRVEAWVAAHVPAADAPAVQTALTALRRVLAQDLEPDPTTGRQRIRRGVAADRMPSLGDPEMRIRRGALLGVTLATPVAFERCVGANCRPFVAQVRDTVGAAVPGALVSIWKDGDLDPYVAFLPSTGTPGVDPSQAGVFVLVGADGITGNQQNGGIEIPAALANDILLIMQGITPPADKSVYPRVAGRRRRQTGVR